MVVCGELGGAVGGWGGLRGAEVRDGVAMDTGSGSEVMKEYVARTGTACILFPPSISGTGTAASRDMSRRGVSAGRCRLFHRHCLERRHCVERPRLARTSPPPLPRGWPWPTTATAGAEAVQCHPRGVRERGSGVTPMNKKATTNACSKR